jgi:hypothetical protein
MKEANGGITFFIIVIVFIIAMAGVMSFTINRSKAFAVEGEVLTIIEDEKGTVLNASGLTSSIKTLINDKLKEAGYRTTASCSNLEGTGWIAFDRNADKKSGLNDAAFCIREVKVDYGDKLRRDCNGASGCTIADDNTFDSYYYELAFFYNLDIPILNQLLRFSAKGTTKVINK